MPGCKLGRGLVDPAPAADVSGAGATFPDLIYAKWIEAYKPRRASA